jgi:broad specificity phosphatase PhoE
VPGSGTDADHRQVTSPPSGEPETLIYLARHGETVWNRDRIFQGQEDVPLSEIGRLQARATADRMAGLGLAAVYTSDLARARDTAEPIARAAGIERVEPTAALREAHFGLWQGKTIEEVYAAYPREAAMWRADSVAYRPEGGERLQDVFERSVDFFLGTLPRHPGERIALIGHGGSIKSIICHVLGAPLSAFRHVRLDNCSITTLLYTPVDANLVLIGLNDTSHLGSIPAHGAGDE